MKTKQTKLSQIREAVEKTILQLNAALDKHGHCWSYNERRAVSKLMKLLNLP